MASREGAPNPESPGIRLDVFLKNAGILKRRSQAQSFCAAGAVSVNGHPAKSGKLIYTGDQVRIETWKRRLVVVVRTIPKKGSGRGEKCYEVLEEERKPSEDFA